MGRKQQLRRLMIATAVFVLFILLGLLAYGRLTHRSDPRFGVTFSTQYAEYLGLEPQDVYTAMLEDFARLDAIRLPVYWDDIEPQRGEYNFELLDQLMDQAEEYEVDVTLVIGMKVPRWPECFIPAWAGDVKEATYKAGFFAMIETVVERYREHPALERWQVENEPFFPFGDCPRPDPDRFEQTVRFVRLLDPEHPIQSTTSGEQALWFLRTWNIDVLGVSLYREVWNKALGAFIFPHPPIVYEWQRILAEPFVDEVIISELQMEPWIPEDIGSIDESIDELYHIFPIEDMNTNMAFARQIGVDEIDLWGVEWWYFMRQQGEPRLWEWAQHFFNIYDNEETE